jgi:ElaB/YqjD/DUF883 family membrane-anchored ribosome-binding protein
MTVHEPADAASTEDRPPSSDRGLVDARNEGETGTGCGAGTCCRPLHRQDFAKGISKAREQAGLLKAQAMRTATGALRDADGAVHQHPYRALGIAAGVALLAGFLAARR